MTEEDLAPGVIFCAPNQGTNITPYAVQGVVVWVGVGLVHYRLQGSPQIKETPVQRFLAIVNGGRYNG